MKLPQIAPTRLQRVVGDIEFDVEFQSFDELCAAVAASDLAKNLGLTSVVIGALLVHHKIATKVEKPESVPEVADEPEVSVTSSGAGKGKKQCPSCQKYVGVRTEVCECGHQFKSKNGTSVPKEQKEPREIPTFDTGGKGKKQCPACQKYVGGRTGVCACGHEFASKSAPVESTPVEKKVAAAVQPTVGTTVVPTRRVGGGRTRIHTPPGGCPHRLMGTDANSVEEWAERCRKTFMDRDESFLTLPALKYFASEFYPRHTSTEVWKATGESRNPDNLAVCEILETLYPN